MSDTAIRVENLAKEFRIGTKQVGYKTFRDLIANSVKGLVRPRDRSGAARNGESNIFWALNDLSFEIKRGEVVGIVGRNGAGKSTLLKILSRITEPTRGFAEIHGRVSSLLEVGTGFHTELTGRENIYLNGAILGMRRAEIDRKFDEMVEFSEVEKFIDTPVKHYSTGMYLRLAFAVAAHLEPEILLVDEVLAVGDAAFQKKCLGKMEDVAKHGRTILFVSHNMGAVRSLCTKGIVLSHGQLVEEGDVNRCIEYYYKSIGALGPRDGEGRSAADDRCQFGPVVIDGTQGNTIHQSQEFRVSTTLRIDQNVSGFTLFCILEDMHGHVVFHMREESPVFGFRNAPLGQYAASLKFPALWMNPGLYSIYFKVIFWGKSSGDRHLSDKFPLDVEGASAATDCLLNPKVEWQVERMDKAVEELRALSA